MTFTVYGLRLRNDTEVRYVGQTSQALESRLAGHRSRQGRTSNGQYRGSAFGHWLESNKADVETFAISQFATRAEAKTAEQFVIGFCLRLNHRLFNGDHVPVARRIARKRYSTSPAALMPESCSIMATAFALTSGDRAVAGALPALAPWGARPC